MDIKDLKNQIKKGESDTVEFKESFNEDAIQTLGALHILPWLTKPPTAYRTRYSLPSPFYPDPTILHYYYTHPTA